MSVFRLIVKDGEKVAIDFGRFMMVTISKAILIRRPMENQGFNASIEYTPMPNQMSDALGTHEKSEIIANFAPGVNEVKVENLYYDTMNPKISVPFGAEVKFEGTFTSPEEFADPDYDEDEVDSSSTVTPDDEEDEDFVDEETE